MARPGRRERSSRIAIVALGYADGILRSASGVDRKAGGAAIVAGKRCPIVGDISMDLTCIDVTEIVDGPVHRGDIATFIGKRSPSTKWPHPPARSATRF